MTKPFSMSVDQACKYTGLGRSFLYEAIGKGKIATRKVGARRVVLTDSLERFVETGAAEHGAAQ